MVICLKSFNFEIMNKNWLLWIGGGIATFIAYNIFQKGRTGVNLNISIDGITFDSKAKQGIVIMKIINPLATEITISSIISDVIWNGNTIGTVSLTQPTTIQGLKTTLIRLPISFNLVGGAMFILELVQKGKNVLSKAKFQVTGKLNANGVLFPIDYVYNFS